MLVRDPRDIAISFYEYTQVVLNRPIAQEQFLHEVDFHLAAGTDLGGLRRSNIAPMSVIDALGQFMAHWYATALRDNKTHLVQFESLIESPTESFQALAAKLNLKAKRPTKKLLGTPISRYDRKRRPRGAAGGWRSVHTRYAAIISGVERSLGAEMQLHGYPLSGA